MKKYKKRLDARDRLGECSRWTIDNLGLHVQLDVVLLASEAMWSELVFVIRLIIIDLFQRISHFTVSSKSYYLCWAEFIEICYNDVNCCLNWFS